MRLFIGIDLPTNVKKSLFQSQIKLKKLRVKGTYKFFDYLHVTLEFLGDVPTESIPVLIEIINSVAKNNKRFCLQIDGFGTFSSSLRVHTIWAGVSGNLNPLNKIRDELHAKLEASGFSLSKNAFKPHVTLVIHPKMSGFDILELRLRKTEHFKVSEIVLFESKMEEGRRVYPKLFSGKLSS